MRIIQSIFIPNRVSQTIFDLPCIFSCHKESDGRICYLLYDWDSQGQYIKVHPGQWLCEYSDHSWNVLSREEYNAYRMSVKAETK